VLGRRPRVEEIFILNAVFAVVCAAALIWWRRALLLEYFYFAPLLSLTHLLTLGFLSSLMMGVLYRLAPMLLGVEAWSRRIATFQLLSFLVGAWGMIAHFWIGEWTGMSWSAILVFLSSLLQLWNFPDLFLSKSAQATWTRRFVASSVIYYLVAAGLGLVLALAKAYDLRFSFLSPQYLSNVFAHAHLAAVGWVTSMIFGFQLALVPTTAANPRALPYRFALFHVGTLGLAIAFLAGLPAAPFAIVLLVCASWQAYGPALAFLKGRAREWELLPLLLLVTASALGVALTLGWPDPQDPARGRAQLAYAFLGLFGFMVASVVTVAFKLFPIWVWKERFQTDFGKRPVPGMKDLPSSTLRVTANVATTAGALGTAVAIFLASPGALLIFTSLLLAGVLSFVANFLRVVRWSLLAIDYQPTADDERKFRAMFRRESPTSRDPRSS
jgi:hypothetical protein